MNRANYNMVKIKKLARTALTSLLLVLVLFSSTGCATLFGGGSDEKLSVESSAPIKVKIIGSEGQIINKTTPFTIDIDRAQNYTVKVQSDEYESQDIYVGRKVRSLSILNLFCILCWGVDFATGNIWEHKMHHVFIDLNDLDKKKAMGSSTIDALITLNIIGKDPSAKTASMKLSKVVLFNKLGAESHS